MKKIIIILILASSLFFGCSRSNLPQESEELAESDIASPEQVLDYKGKKASTTEDAPRTAKVFLVIDFSGGEIKEIEVEFKEKMTVFDFLQEGVKESGIFLQARMYNIGVFIEIIGDKKNGQDRKYWSYYVNGDFAQVAADKFELKAGDKVEWKFGKSPF